MEVRVATLADEEAVCRFWTMLLNYYHRNAAPEILQSSFRFAVNHLAKVLIFIILIEGVVTGTDSLQLGHYST